MNLSTQPPALRCFRPLAVVLVGCLVAGAARGQVPDVQGGDPSGTAAQGIPLVSTVEDAPPADGDGRLAGEVPPDAAGEAPIVFGDPAEAERLTKEFEEARVALAQAIIDLRETQILYLNEVDRSAAAVERYRRQRDIARERMNQAFSIGLALIRHKADPAAATYLLTLVQNHEANDIYDVETFEAAGRLLNGGLRQAYLARAAARSGLVCGEFETTRSVYEKLEESNMEEVDQRLKSQIDEIERQYAEEMQELEKDQQQELPRVLFKTTRGDIVVELFLRNAPSTVSHFIKLVESGFYEELDFYQVKDGLFALTGDPTAKGTGNAGQFLADEHTRADHRHALRGSLVMVKIPLETGVFLPNSASSQFTINFLPLPNASDYSTVFGRVIEGMDVASMLRRVDPFEEKEKGTIVAPPDRILSAEVIRRPERLPEPVYATPGMPPTEP